MHIVLHYFIIRWWSALTFDAMTKRLITDADLMTICRFVKGPNGTSTWGTRFQFWVPLAIQIWNAYNWQSSIKRKQDQIGSWSSWSRLWCLSISRMMSWSNRRLKVLLLYHYYFLNEIILVIKTFLLFTRWIYKSQKFIIEINFCHVILQKYKMAVYYIL